MKAKVILCIFFVVPLFLISQTKKIQELEGQRKQVLLEIENTNKLISTTKNTTANLLNRINLLASQITSRQKLVSILNQEVESITKQQKEIEKEITELEKELKKSQDNYANAVKGMIHKKQNKNRLLFVLSGKSFGESVRRMKYLKDYSDWQKKQADDIREKKEQLNAKQLELEKSKKEKLTLLSQRKAEQERLKKEEESYRAEMLEASKKQKELQAIINQKQKQINTLNAQIEKLIAEEVARQEREAKRLAEEKARLEREKKGQTGKDTGKTEKPTTSTSVKETKEDVKLSSNFESNKGKFPMPVTGSSRIVTRFGTHHHNQWNVTTNSNGIDIQAEAGAQARSIFDGEISRIIAFPGFNNCIIIRHGSYYSFYGNIQQVHVKQGQKVTTGQSLGKVFTDPDTGNSQLHFQLWKGTTKLNPEPWLKK